MTVAAMRFAALPPLVAAAARVETQVRRRLRLAVREAQDLVDLSAIDAALAVSLGTGAVEYVMQDAIDALEAALIDDLIVTEVPVPFRSLAVRPVEKLPRLIQRALISGGRITGHSIGMDFDLDHPDATTWARRHAAKLVVDISAKTRLAIRTLVTEAFSDGVAPRETARLLRSVIGLTDRDAAAVMKRRRTLLAKATTKIQRAKATKKAEAYADKLLRRRALTIARTETMAAAIEGQQQAWNQAIRAGLLTGREQKVWITADPCPICAPMDGEKVSLVSDFPIPGPPAHPNCRCTVGMVN